MVITSEVLALARIIWDFHWLREDPVPGDVIVALGTNDLRVAEFAAELYQRGHGSTLVCSGGVAHQNDMLATGWDKTEAEMYAEVALARGVPRERILLESRSTNTSQNLQFTRALLEERALGARLEFGHFAVRMFLTWKLFYCFIFVGEAIRGHSKAA